MGWNSRLKGPGAGRSKALRLAEGEAGMVNPGLGKRQWQSNVEAGAEGTQGPQEGQQKRSPFQSNTEL